MSSTVLGLDPGPEYSGVVIYDVAAGRVAWACKQAANLDVRGWLLDWGEAPEAAGPCPYSVVIEALSPRGQVVGWETFRTIAWVGRFEEASHFCVSPSSVRVVHRDDIKRTLLGRTNIAGADKHIRQVLLDTVGPKGTKREPGPTYGVSGHAWAALAAVVAQRMDA